MIVDHISDMFRFIYKAIFRVQTKDFLYIIGNDLRHRLLNCSFKMAL